VTVALEHAILVALRERPASGYELARRFDRSIGFFWTATHQQIYTVLRRMDGLGWVRGEVVAQDDRPDKKVYATTPDGDAELARWLGDPLGPQPQRLDIGVKVRATATGDQAMVAAVLADLRRQRDRHAERLAEYLAMEVDDPVHGLVLRGGVMIEKGWLEWCEDAIRVLEELP
jgi:DNA-binding PadR family transcriptional regulator